MRLTVLVPAVALALAVPTCGSSYFYDTFIKYEAKVTDQHVNDEYYISIGDGFIILGKKWEALNPSYSRPNGRWSFSMFRPQSAPTCGNAGPRAPFWTFECQSGGTPGSYIYSHLTVPAWFVVLLAAVGLGAGVCMPTRVRRTPDSEQSTKVAKA